MSLRRLVTLGIAAVVVSTAACSTKAAMTAEDARAFTKRALGRVGYANAIVDANPSRARCQRSLVGKNRPRHRWLPTAGHPH